MAHSSLIGIDRPPERPAGTDNASLGPSDSSDTGSDMAGAPGVDAGDPNLPVDMAIAADRMNPDDGAELTSLGVDSDVAGTGERRAAAGDAGSSEAPDILPDRIVSTEDALRDDPDDELDWIQDGSEDPGAVIAVAGDDVAGSAEGDPGPGTENARRDEGKAPALGPGAKAGPRKAKASASKAASHAKAKTASAR